MVEEIKESETVKEEQTPPQNPELEALRVRLSTMETELTNTKKGLTTAHQTITEKDKELKKRVNLESQVSSIQDTIELLTTAFATRGEIGDLDSTERQGVLAELKKKRDTQEAKRKEEEAQLTQQEFTQKANVLYSKAVEVFGDDDDSIDKVADLIGKGWLERAEERITKAENKKKEPPKKENVETEEQRVEKLAQDKLNKLLEERGLLEEHSSSPSVTGSASEAMAKYISGEITADEAKKRGVRFS